MKKIKNFKTVLGVVIVGLTTLLPSCVQGDFSDLYDEELVWSNGIPRTKSGDDIQWGGGASQTIVNSTFMGEGECALNAIMCATKLSYDIVKTEMIRVQNNGTIPQQPVNISYYATSNIPIVINNLKGTSVSIQSFSSVVGSSDADSINIKIKKNTIVLAAGVPYYGATEYHAMNFSYASEKNGEILIHFVSTQDKARKLSEISSVIQ